MDVHVERSAVEIQFGHDITRVRTRDRRAEDYALNLLLPVLPGAADLKPWVSIDSDAAAHAYAWAPSRFSP